MRTGSLSSIWRLNSVRWLEEHQPHLIGATSGRLGATHQLRTALARINYLEADLEFEALTTGEPMTREMANSERHALIDNWSETAHRNMIEFIEAGGYKTRREALFLGLPLEKMTMTGDDGKELPERIEVVKNGKKPRSSKRKPAGSADTELEDALVYAGPIAGSW